jgi:hypothetical protein
MRYSIITATILRPGLLTACASLDSQTNKDWEHIITCDRPSNTPEAQELLSKISHPQRTIVDCSRVHNDYGSTCKHEVWERARGEYVYYLDDDNYLSHNGVLEDLMQVTGVWALFPIMHYRKRFCNIPPGVDRTDTGNFLAKREHARFGLREAHHSDGLLVEYLKTVAPYQDLTHITPVLIYEAQNSAEEIKRRAAAGLLK